MKAGTAKYWYIGIAAVFIIAIVIAAVLFYDGTTVSLSDINAAKEIEQNGYSYSLLVDYAQELGCDIKIKQKNAGKIDGEKLVEYNYELKRDGELLGSLSVALRDGEVAVTTCDQIFNNISDGQKGYIVVDGNVYVLTQAFALALNNKV
ncbi:MAG: hypothetical protein ACI3VB_08380 [Oscillospiraceae bacterium]